MQNEITKELTEKLTKYFTSHSGHPLTRSIEITCKHVMSDS